MSACRTRPRRLTIDVYTQSTEACVRVVRRHTIVAATPGVPPRAHGPARALRRRSARHGRGAQARRPRSRPRARGRGRAPRLLGVCAAGVGSKELAWRVRRAGAGAGARARAQVGEPSQVCGRAVLAGASRGLASRHGTPDTCGRSRPNAAADAVAWSWTRTLRRCARPQYVLQVAHEVDWDSRASPARQPLPARRRTRRNDRDHRPRPPGGATRATRTGRRDRTADRRRTTATRETASARRCPARAGRRCPAPQSDAL